MSLFEMSGTVEAPDGSTYDPLYVGGWHDTARVVDALRDGCHERGDGYTVRVHRVELGERISRVALYTQPVDLVERRTA